MTLDKSPWRIRLEYQRDHAAENCDWNIGSDIDEALLYISKLESLAVAEKEENARLRTVVAAARCVGMNWKAGVPHGFDDLNFALSQLDGGEGG